jgi:hypothetical protein
MSQPTGAIRESEEDIAGGGINNCSKSEQGSRDRRARNPESQIIDLF